MNPSDALPRSLRLLERPATRQAAAPARELPSVAQAHGWSAMIDRYFAWGERLQRQPPALGCPMRSRPR